MRKTMLLTLILTGLCLASMQLPINAINYNSTFYLDNLIPCNVLVTVYFAPEYKKSKCKTYCVSDLPYIKLHDWDHIYISCDDENILKNKEHFTYHPRFFASSDKHVIIGNDLVRIFYCDKSGKVGYNIHRGYYLRKLPVISKKDHITPLDNGITVNLEMRNQYCDSTLDWGYTFYTYKSGHYHFGHDNYQCPRTLKLYKYTKHLYLWWTNKTGVIGNILGTGKVVDVSQLHDGDIISVDHENGNNFLFSKVVPKISNL